MSQRVLGVIGVRRTGGSRVNQVFEALILTEDRVIVVRTATGGAFGWGTGNAISAWYKAGAQEEHFARISPEEILNADKTTTNYRIRKSRNWN